MVILNGNYSNLSFDVPNAPVLVRRAKSRCNLGCKSSFFIVAVIPLAVEEDELMEESKSTLWHYGYVCVGVVGEKSLDFYDPGILSLYHPFLLITFSSIPNVSDRMIRYDNPRQ